VKSSVALRADHVALSIRSLQRSRDFYVGLLGGVVTSKPSDTFVEVALGNACVHLLPMATGPAAPIHGAHVNHFSLAVETHAELIALRDALNTSPLVSEYGPFEIVASPPQGADGGTHVERRPPRATLYFCDPDGVRLEVRCYQ
jgi:catechol 2,3-dioxygenase-like lactoylglutathione lyase family enzyme